MTTAAEFQANVDKATVNFQRFDSVVNGGPDVVVTTDSGEVPSLAKVIAEIGYNADAAEEAAAAALSAGAASASAISASASAASAEAVSGPTYASTAAGLAATTNGQSFAVNPGTGVVTIYLNSAGSAVAQRTLATTAYLAASTGAAQIGAVDGASGTLWTTVAGFISRLLSSAGSASVGFLQAGSGAVARTVQTKLRERINVKDFGALGNNSANDTAAITAAINAAATAGGDVYFPAGIYRHTGIAIANLRFVRLIGEANSSFSSAGTKGVRLVCTSGTANHLDFTNAHGVTVEHFQMECVSGTTPSAGAAIRFYSTDGGSAYCGVKHVRLENCYNGVLIDGCSNSWAEHLTLRTCKGLFAVKVIGSGKRVDQVRIADVVIDTEVTGGSTTCVGVDIDTNSHTIWLDRISALQCKYGVYLHGATAPEFVRMNGVEAENSYSHGFLIDTGAHIWLDQVYATINRGSGIVFGATFTSTAVVTAPDARGNKEHGILLNGSGGIQIIAPRIGQNSNTDLGATTNTSDGISIGGGVSNVTVIGGKSGGNINLTGTGTQRYGIDVNTGASDNIIVTGVNLTGNATGPLAYNGTGTNRKVRDNIGQVDLGYSRGTLTVTTGNTTGVFAHNLGANPAQTIVAPTSDPGTGRWWVTKNSTQVIVNFGTAVAGNVTFDVEAFL